MLPSSCLRKSGDIKLVLLRGEFAQAFRERLRAPSSRRSRNRAVRSSPPASHPSARACARSAPAGFQSRAEKLRWSCVSTRNTTCRCKTRRDARNLFHRPGRARSKARAGRTRRSCDSRSDAPTTRARTFVLASGTSAKQRSHNTHGRANSCIISSPPEIGMVVDDIPREMLAPRQQTRFRRHRVVRKTTSVLHPRFSHNACRP